MSAHTHKHTHTHTQNTQSLIFFRRAAINIYALAESINTSGQSKNQCTPATYFNLPMKVTLLQQCLRGRSTLTHTHTHTQTNTYKHTHTDVHAQTQLNQPAAFASTPP